ncbi:HTTM domain-containing protein [Myroides albus]|uniref:HTTM domain-containing protein n=1 Tax=Myroides albus TaxID=2562892 RepID=UPI0021598046|nr:HTTM domain-containing protein [Myroides albus]UVD80849.1 HTTM domain-containing protein [Myroides albus]
MWKKALQPIDNSPLVIFRIFFGFLFACESFGAIATGWVRTNLVDVQMTFSHIYMDFLQVLVGPQMYVYFALMGFVSIAVMLGWRYRLNIVLLTILWAGAYFIQKTSYNNHYYMLLLICFYMCFLPAHQYASMDVKAGRVDKKLYMPRYFSWFFIFQVTILYVFGTVAKFYPDWLDGTFTRLMYQSANIPEVFKEVFTQKWFYITIAYLGIIFDGLIVPMLLWKKTRTLGVIAALTFHLFNSATLHIGIFPYFALSFSVFFYEPEQVRRLFFKKKPVFEVTDDLTSYGTQNFLSKGQLYVLSAFMVVQVLLPLRIHFIKGDTLWTDEGHRLSWRMMLRSRGGYTDFIVENKDTKTRSYYPLAEVLSTKQAARLTSPDMIWQMAQVIKKEYAAKGEDVAVYADSFVSINGRPYSRFVDNTVDLGNVGWNYFTHCPWILEKPF